MDFIDNNQYLYGRTVQAFIKGVDPTCTPESAEQKSKVLTDREVQAMLGALATGEAELDYKSKTRNLIVDLQHYVTSTVEQEKEARETERQEEEKEKIEYEHTLAVTTVLKRANDFLVQVSHPVIITPNSNVVALCHLFPSVLGEDINVNSTVSVDEIRAITEQIPEFVLLDNLVDTTMSVCIDLAINMPKTKKLTDNEIQQLLDATSSSELEGAGISRAKDSGEDKS